MAATTKTRKSGRSTKKTTGRTRSSQSSKDAVALLKADHERLRGLLSKLENGRGSKAQLLQDIENEVKVHTQIEEEIFYPAFRDAVRSKEDRKLFFEAIEEHHVVDLVMPEIKSTDEDSDEFPAKAKVLKDLIEHHVEEEESEMFPKARKVMGAARLRELGQELEERKQSLQGRGRGLFGMGRRRAA